MERKRWSIGDLLMWQISLFGPATCDRWTDKSPDEETTRYEEVGEGERESPPERSGTPE